MKFKIYLILHLIFQTSFLFPNEKLKFSADFAESYIENNLKIKVFKDNVKIIDKDKILFTDLAKYLQDSNKVILSGNVKMFNQLDTLSCNELIIFQNNNKRYEAQGNVIFNRKSTIIKSEKLLYFTDSEQIEAFENVYLKNENNEIYGQSLKINYKNNKVSEINMFDEVNLINKKFFLFKDNNLPQLLEDNMTSNILLIYFDENESIDSIKLMGMAQANFNAISDSLLKGYNNVSGDTILIEIKDDELTNMFVKGGAIGSFQPDKKNENLLYNISYNAEEISYDLENELTYLVESAKVVYGETTLKGGEINADLKTNIVESKISKSIIPSVKTGNESPTFGHYMKFNLYDETGTIEQGYNKIDMGIFQGDSFITDKNEDIYIENGVFTSCDIEEPHYHFESNIMKVDNQNNQIIARPMRLYIQDFPLITLPFAVLPNSNQNRKSGFIMPSFGHSKNNGTWIEDLGYYYAPNDYYDIITYLDFYDRSKVKLDSKINYKKTYGNNWYNYHYYGHFQINNFINELNPSNNDFINLFDKEKSTTKYSSKFAHNQDFGNNQFIRLKYEYYNFENLSDVVENNARIRLDQKEISQIYYSKSWDNSSLSIGASSFRNLILPEPDYANQLRDYKKVDYPSVNFQYNNPLLFGKTDKWFGNTKLSYNLSHFNESISYSKKSTWQCQDQNGLITSDLNSEQCLQDNNIWEGECFDSDYNQLSQIVSQEDCLSSNNIWILDWVKNGISNQSNPSLENKLTIKIPFNFLYFNINPNIVISEQWSLDGISKIKAKKRQGSLGINLQTNIYGTINSSLIFRKIQTFRHIITPSINTIYISKNQLISGSYDDFNQTRFNINDDLINNYSLISSFNINNRLQAKILNEDNELYKREILTYNFYTSYNWDTKLFNALMSSISLKDKAGGEYLRLNIEQSFYRKDSNEFLNGLPRLVGMSTSISRNFGYTINSDEYSESETNQKSKKQNLWDASFGFTLTAKYDLQKKWDLEYSTLSLNSNIRLTNSWLMKNNFYIDMVDLEINSYEAEFIRSLHCWDFSFFIKPIGYNQGFGLKISISEPNLQSLKVTQSSRVRGNNW